MTNPTDRPHYEKTFGLNLKESRRALDLTQAEVARRAAPFGFKGHQSAIARIEAGERAISLDEAAALAWAVDRTLGDLLAGREVADAPNEGEMAIQLALLRADVAKIAVKLLSINMALGEGARRLVAAAAPNAAKPNARRGSPRPPARKTDSKKPTRKGTR